MYIYIHIRNIRLASIIAMSVPPPQHGCDVSGPRHASSDRSSPSPSPDGSACHPESSNNNIRIFKHWVAFDHHFRKI